VNTIAFCLIIVGCILLALALLDTAPTEKLKIAAWLCGFIAVALIMWPGIR